MGFTAREERWQLIIESVIFEKSMGGLSAMVKGAASLAGRQLLEKSVKEGLDRALKPALATSLSNFGIVDQALFALDLTKAETDALEEFLASPLFEAFIRALGLLAVTDTPSLTVQQAVLADYIEKVLPGKPEGAITAFTAAIVDFIEKAAPDAWQTAISQGLLGPSWIDESVIQNLVSDHVSNARAQLEFRIGLNAASFREIETFVERYKRATRVATSKLRPQSVNESPAIPINDLYVEPLLSFSSDKGAGNCSRDMLLASSRRSVLLGNPGGGKSTLAGKLCYDICADAIDRTVIDAPTLAAQVVLRDYAQFQKTTPCSIAEYLELHCKSELQIDAPPGAFKLLLLSGRILVIFDGLDELIETTDRLAVRSAVEHFALEFPVAPILVTSREVGYEQASLDRAQFAHYKLSPFGGEQVHEYATKWFRYSCANLTEGSQLARSFMAESAIIPDIRSNPLMLGLLCNLYRQDGFIPKNRPDIYQRCADLLFTKWDRSRGIHVKLPLDHRLRPAMSFLAHWIYSNEQLQAGVTENYLIAKTTEYLRQWVEDDAEAEHIAKEFITFFSGRAWVFTDTGSDKIQRLYQFTHRTFLEYFTADELVRFYPKGEDLHDHLKERVSSRSWDVVCQLAYQINAQRTLSNNILVDLLCRDSESNEFHQKLKILSFLTRTMDMLYPMPPVRRRAVKVCTNTIFGNLPKIIAAEELKTLAIEIMTGLLKGIIYLTPLPDTMNGRRKRNGRQSQKDFWQNHTCGAKDLPEVLRHDDKI